MTRVLAIGLDCLGPEVLDPTGPSHMPNLSRILSQGMGGRLESVLPPITVPAWASMFTGLDPGELGLYGFRNRTTPSSHDLARATGDWVRAPMLWDELDAAGRPTVTVGMPLTSPVKPKKAGALICGFEGPQGSTRAWTPQSLESEIPDLNEYVFDIDGFREAEPEYIIDLAYRMTKRRFVVFSHLLESRQWDFAALHEIGPDRMHHCFWRDHDPAHPRHQPHSPYANFITDYYAMLDELVGELIALAPEDTAILLASDHGATPMHGAICVNELLREADLLTLRHEPEAPFEIESTDIDWEHTKAWAQGGYYARVFYNLSGREEHGVVAPDAVPQLEAQLQELFGSIDLGDGRTLQNKVAAPRDLYRRVRGVPPDLLVFFEKEHWRATSLVGAGKWLDGDNRGIDHANHARNGFYALEAPGIRPIGWRDASILDIAPTLRSLLGLPVSLRLQGRDLLKESAYEDA